MDTCLKEDLERIAGSSIVTENVERFRGKSVLVTGATGLIGSLLVRSFLAINAQYRLGMKVYAVIRNPEKAAVIYGNAGENSGNSARDWGNAGEDSGVSAGESGNAGSGPLRFIQADITDPAFVQKALRETAVFDYIFHAAAVTQSKVMVTKPIETIDAALMGTRNLLELAATVETKSFVYISSMEVYGDMSVYGPGEGRATEDRLGYINPEAVRSNYPESKRMCENLCVAYLAEKHVPVKTARLAQTFGAGILPWEKRVFAQFAQAVIDGTDIVLHTTGRSEGNYCYSADCMEGLLTILLKGKDGEAYNVVNEACHTTIAGMARLVAEKFGEGKVKVVFDIPATNTYGYAADTKLFLDGSKLRKLGWEPKTDLAGMYRRLIASMRWQQEK